MIEGVYVLQQWSIDGVSYAPPQVDGRFVLIDGVAIAILHNRIDANNRSSATLFGRYRLDAQIFAYGYDDASTITHTPAGIGGNEQVPWLGTREFAISGSNDNVQATSAENGAEFVFSRAGFSYAEHGTVLRRWARVGNGEKNR